MFIYKTVNTDTLNIKYTFVYFKTFSVSLAYYTYMIFI